MLEDLGLRPGHRLLVGQAHDPEPHPEAGFCVPLRRMGLPDEETVPGPQGETLGHYGISPAGLAAAARALLQSARGGPAFGPKVEGTR